jgi:hypothetical protein
MTQLYRQRWAAVLSPRKPRHMHTDAPRGSLASLYRGTAWLRPCLLNHHSVLKQSAGVMECATAEKSRRGTQYRFLSMVTSK